MVEQGHTRRGCLKSCCLGCVGVCALGLVVAVGVVLVALVTGRPDPVLEQSALEQPLPGPAGAAAGPHTDRAPLSSLPDLGPEPDEPGRVLLDLSVGEFEIVAGPAGEPIRVDGEYDTAAFELITALERYGERGWIYRVRFGRRISWLRFLMGESVQAENRLRIVLPRGVPMTLEGRVGLGETTMRLGELWLLETDLTAGAGALSIDFDAPLQAPMRRFRLSASVGELRVSGLGNASPAQTYIAQRIGELSVDLRGRWTTDGELDIRSSLGELAVRVPDDLHVVIEDSGVTLGESAVPRPLDVAPSPDAPTLRLRVSQGIGELRVSR